MAITAPIELVYLGGAALLSGAATWRSAAACKCLLRVSDSPFIAAMAVSLMGIEFNEKKKEEEEKH